MTRRAEGKSDPPPTVAVVSASPDVAAERRLRWFSLAASAALVPLSGGRARALSPPERRVALAVVRLAFEATGDGNGPIETSLDEVGEAAGLGDDRHVIAVLDVLHRAGVIVAEPLALVGGRIRLELIPPPAVASGRRPPRRTPPSRPPGTDRRYRRATAPRDRPSRRQPIPAAPDLRHARP